jgi:hypothetical protein
VDEELRGLEVGQDGDRIIDGQPAQPAGRVVFDAPSRIGDGDDEIDLAPGEVVADVRAAALVDLEEAGARTPSALRKAAVFSVAKMRQPRPARVWAAP